jgi:hypothetical protein
MPLISVSLHEDMSLLPNYGAAVLLHTDIHVALDLHAISITLISTNYANL